MSCLQFLWNLIMASGTSKPTKEMKARVESFALALTKKGIKLLAVDFDKTLIDFHSGGVWDESIDKLTPHVRLCMRDLLEAAIHKGVYVAIVTFHRQPWTIEELLNKVLPKKVARKIYVKANSDEFLKRQRTLETKSRAGGLQSLDGQDAADYSAAAGHSVSVSGQIWAASLDLQGKEAHIAAVISQIQQEHQVTIEKNEILLMDDDMMNIRSAISAGHLAFQVQQNVDYASFESFQTMLLL